jgi:hypothetical protein
MCSNQNEALLEMYERETEQLPPAPSFLSSQLTTPPINRVEKKEATILPESLIKNKNHKSKHRHHHHHHSKKVSNSTNDFLLQVFASRLHQKSTNSHQMMENVHYELNGQSILQNVFRERAVDLYRDQTRLDEDDYQCALVLVKHGVRKFSGHDATVAEVYGSIFTMMNSSFARVFAYVSSLAGCSQLPMHTCALLLKGTFFMIHGGFIMHKLYVNGEYYQFLPNNIQLTRRLVYLNYFVSKLSNL